MKAAMLTKELTEPYKGGLFKFGECCDGEDCRWRVADITHWGLSERRMVVGIVPRYASKLRVFDVRRELTINLDSHDVTIDTDGRLSLSGVWPATTMLPRTHTSGELFYHFVMYQAPPNVNN